jgi:hypothetical protein
MEITSVLLIAYIFLTPLPFYLKVLNVGLLIFLISIFARSMSSVQTMINTAMQGVWMNHLSLRFAIDGIITNVMTRQIDHIDWRDASRQAVDDIKSARDDDEVKDQLSGGASTSIFVYIVFLPFMLFGRALLGFGIAYAIQTYTPRFGYFLITGSWA